VIRFWFIALVVGALLSHFTPNAFACEGDHGDSAGGHMAIAFCSEHSDGHCDKAARIVSTFPVAHLR
jgi:hypothetical protein